MTIKCPLCGEKGLDVEFLPSLRQQISECCNDCGEALTAEQRDTAFKEWEDNYDGPPDGEAWSGGFADNH